MAVFDPDLHRIVVRIVYDGPGFAGKTTNVERLHGFFTARRRSEVFVPEAIDGRTQYFDWMHLDGGLVQGYSLRCQLVTVPGQRMLVRRRWELLRNADVVVFVCDSSTAGVEEARAPFRLLSAYLGGRGADGPALVLQANKQDLPDALSPEAVREALGCPEHVPTLPARASEGTGVRETAVLAIRAAANRVQDILLGRGIDALRGSARSAEQVLEELRRAELVELPPYEQELIQLVDPTGHPEEPPAEAAVDDAPEAPPLPDPDVPTGFIWPAATGRDVLRRVAGAGAPLRRHDLAGRHGTDDGSGSSDVLIYESGLWCLKTSPRRRFDDADDARTALLRLARSKVMLGSLLPLHSVLSLRRDAEGSYWLWTVCPWLTTIRALLGRAAERNGESELAEALDAYARAAVDSMVLAARRGVVLDVHPSNFAVVGDRVAYLDDDIGDGGRIPSIGHALLQRVHEYGAHPAAIAAYVESLEREMQDRLRAEDAERLGLPQAIGSVTVRSTEAQRARERLVEVAESLPRETR